MTQRRKLRVLVAAAVAAALSIGTFSVVAADESPRFASWWQFEQACYEAGGEPAHSGVIPGTGPLNDCVKWTGLDELGYWTGLKFLGSRYREELFGYDSPPINGNCPGCGGGGSW